MESFKEFQGKSLDDAIRDACAYFDAPREKLEIEIVQDAKNGIFGLVGARKAVVKARRARFKASVGVLLGRGENPAQLEERKRRESETTSEGAPRQGEAAAPERPRKRRPPASAPSGEERCAFRSREVEEPVRPAVPVRKVVVEELDFEPDQEEAGEYAFVPFAELDREKLLAAARETAEKLITPVLGPVAINVTAGEGRVDVRVHCGEDSGLLIGREGQTLAALQYLASRIVSRAMNAPVRMQFDVGDYRERQDERLRELALSLAERVRATGRSCSTRPLSSYHRRIIHLTLQNAPDVQTRSSGEGPLKRVIVLRRRFTPEHREA